MSTAPQPASRWSGGSARCIRSSMTDAHRDVGVGLERVELEVVEDGDVEAAAAQRRQRLLGLGLGQAQADARMGLAEAR